MRSKIRAGALAALATAAMSAMSAAADAATFSVNFGGNESTAVTAPAGAEVDTLNYNQVNGNGPFSDRLLNDEAGTATSTSLSFARSGAGAADQWHTDASTSTGDGQLLRGVLKTKDIGTAGATMTFTFANVPTGVYDLYAYTVNNENAKSQQVDVSAGGITYYVAEPNVVNSPAEPVFVRATSTDPAARTTGNYVMFDDIATVADQVTLTLFSPGSTDTGGGPASQMGIAGIQLIAVPEPTSVAVLGLGAAPLMMRRRRRA